MNEYELIGLFFKIILPIVISLITIAITITKMFSSYIEKINTPINEIKTTIENLIMEMAKLNTELKFIREHDEKQDEDILSLNENKVDVLKKIENHDVRISYLEEYGCKKSLN